MAWFKSHPLFCSLLIVVGLAALGEGYLLYDRVGAAKKAAVRFAQKERELQAFKAVTPFPSTENAEAIEADLALATSALHSLQAELKGRGEAAVQIQTAMPPGAPTDAFFDLASFVERTRALATSSAVAIKADERFGFSAYANTGPALELIPAVFRQRLVTEYLLQALLEARPTAILAVQREWPETKAEREARAAALAAGQSVPISDRQGADIFSIDRRITARVPGFVDAVAIRLVFQGHTGSLRTFLNRLAMFEVPVVVRSVEVEPAAAQNGQTDFVAAPPPDTSLSSVFGGAPGEKDSPAPPKPLVEKKLSRFTVTIEWIDLVTPANTPNP